ncbi:MAG: Sulfotransferase domain protein [Acidimicrobiales bacterium]|nr:Sulfotransferase domain protein [Acidimicrobiales bacterium]
MSELRVRRLARLATAPLRPLPSVLLVGGIRCGSTSLNAWLVANGFDGPLPPTRKEIHFLDRSFDRGSNWYRTRYPLRPTGPTIDATPSYLCLPECPPRAAATMPSAKIVAILREPLDRARSHFAWRTRNGGETAPTLEDALADEPNRQSSPLAMLGCYGLHSRYEVGLGRWLENFGADQMCVLIAEKVFAGDEEELQLLRTFLDHPLDAPFPHVNAGSSAPTPVSPEANPFAATITAVEGLLQRPTGWSAG